MIEKWLMMEKLFFVSLHNYDKKMQEKFILINKYLVSYFWKIPKEDVDFFSEFYQIIKLFFLG